MFVVDMLGAFVYEWYGKWGEENKAKKNIRRIDTINQLPTTHIDWANWV